MPQGPSVRRQRGFSYLLLLFWVAIGGIGLAALGQAWQINAQREREAELRFRGTEYARALGSYQACHGHYPQQLEALLDDSELPQPMRHLRRLYADPITGAAQWGLVRDDKQGIVAVHSLSTAAPLARSETVQSYRDWAFDAMAVPRCGGTPAPDAAASGASAPGGPAAPAAASTTAAPDGAASIPGAPAPFGATPFPSAFPPPRRR